MSPQPKTRMTRQRMVILEELRQVNSHPTAEEIYGMVRKRLPRISLGTVYRNLDLLSAAGDIQKLESGPMRRFDGNPAPHMHVRCVKCGKVADVHAFPAEDLNLAPIDISGFTVTGMRVEYEGICIACSQDT